MSEPASESESAEPLTRTARRARVIDAVEALAADQRGVVSRSQAAELGAGWDRVYTEAAIGRWKAHGRHTIAVHTSELGHEAQWRQALFEVGAGAVLDGATALTAAGLKGYDDRVQVSVRHGQRPRHVPEVKVRELIGWDERDIMRAGVPRVRPVVAAVRAAAWAVSDRQAALVLLMASQQRIARPADMLAHADELLRLSRRTVIEAVLRDALSGVQALGELDFARLCREWGLPEPTRQVMRTRPSGRAYLDVEWAELGIVVEIDGGQHLEPINSLDDSLRQNDVTIGDRIVLRVPNLGLILQPDLFMRQIASLVRARQAALTS